MNNRAVKESDVEMRHKDFWQKHEHYDPKWVRHVLHNLNEFVPFVFPLKSVKRAMTQLYKPIGIEDWIDAPEYLPASELRKLPLFKLALELRAYAYFGLKLKLNDPGVDDFLDHREDNFFPREWGQDPETESTITAAYARRKLDSSGAEGLTPEELAALSRVSRKSILNLLAPSYRDHQGILKTDLDGRITVESAREWLRNRGGFLPSVWQQQSGDPLPSPKLEPMFVGEPLFIPMADDGSWFSPEDRNHRDQRYYVGGGDHEEKFEDYWTALDFLTRAVSPRWRYADTTKRWRMKSATGWVRKTRQELEAIVQATVSDEPKLSKRKRRQ